MTTFRLSRSLVGIFALSYLSIIAVITGLSAFSSSSISMAQGLVSAVATACPKPAGPPPSGDPIQDVTGTLQSISGQTLQIFNAKNTPPSVSTTYSSSTRFTQETSVTAAALKQGARVFIRATQNADSTYTATAITLMPSDQPGNNCFQGDDPSRSPGTPAADRQPRNAGCFRGGSPGQDNSQGTCIAGTIQQVTGTNLTVKGWQGTSYTVKSTSSTTFTQASTASSTALKPNTPITVVGPSKNGVITALYIILLPA